MKPYQTAPSGLENSTRPLIFTSASGCRASENFDISSENYIFPLYANKFCDAGQVPILRYFEACPWGNLISFILLAFRPSPSASKEDICFA